MARSIGSSALNELCPLAWNPGKLYIGLSVECEPESWRNIRYTHAMKDLIFSRMGIKPGHVRACLRIQRRLVAVYVRLARAVWQLWLFCDVVCGECLNSNMMQVFVMTVYIWCGFVLNITVAFALHAAGSISLSYMMLDSWPSYDYWFIFGFTVLLPACAEIVRCFAWFVCAKGLWKEAIMIFTYVVDVKRPWFICRWLLTNKIKWHIIFGDDYLAIVGVYEVKCVRLFVPGN
jgi:Transmembrane protein